MSAMFQLLIECDTCDRLEEHWETYAPGVVPDKAKTLQICKDYGFNVTEIGDVLCDQCAHDIEKRDSLEGDDDVHG